VATTAATSSTARFFFAEDASISFDFGELPEKRGFLSVPEKLIQFPLPLFFTYHSACPRCDRILKRIRLFSQSQGELTDDSVIVKSTHAQDITADEGYKALNLQGTADGMNGLESDVGAQDLHGNGVHILPCCFMGRGGHGDHVELMTGNPSFWAASSSTHVTEAPVSNSASPESGAGRAMLCRVHWLAMGLANPIETWALGPNWAKMVPGGREADFPSAVFSWPLYCM